LLCRQIPSPKPANLDKEPDDSDDPPSPDPNNVTNPGTPDTVAVAAVCQVLASGRDTSALDLTNPLVLCALTSVVNASAEKAKSPGMLAPDSTGVNLLPATEPPQAASPSIRRCLANATSTMLPPCMLRSLGFLDNQALLDANFPTNDRKPIISLFSPRASATTTATTTVSTNNAETTIQVCLPECRMSVFASIIHLDCIGHHNFGSSDHLQLTVQWIQKLHLKCNERGVAINGSPDRLFDKCSALIPLLPATHVNSWGINIFSKLWTVKSWSVIQCDKRNTRLMLQEMAPHNNNRSNRSNGHCLDASANASSAEETMQRCQRPEPSPNQSIQTSYQNPAPGGLVSDHASDFRGCLGCGSSDHVFRSWCPMKLDPTTEERFHRNFNAKFNRPQTEPRERDSSCGPSDRPPGLPPAFNSNATPGSGRGTSNQPAWMTRQNHSRTGGPSGSSQNPASSFTHSPVTALPWLLRTLLELRSNGCKLRLAEFGRVLHVWQSFAEFRIGFWSDVSVD
jgi:hypothetical protein